jgi:hypothetical protein
VDAHPLEIADIAWDEEKKMLISSSLDSSVKMYQFPIFWPAEMIRKNKNKQHLIEEEKIVNREDGIPIEEDFTNENGSQIKLPREMTDEEVNSYDLDGWDE